MAALFLFISSCTSPSESHYADNTPTDNQSADMYILTAHQFQSSDMALGSMELSTFHEVVKANGMLDVPPENRASVSCYFGGTVKDIRLLPGQRVEKGQVLFTLENPDYVQIQQDFLEAKNQLAYLKSDYERQKNLVQDNVTSQKSYLKSESDYNVTKVKVESLSKKLILMNIHPNTLTMENITTTVPVLSPINGYVTEVAIQQGTFLYPSQMAVSIVDIAHLHLELQIFEKDLAKVKAGQPIQFKIQNDMRNDYRAIVHYVNKTVDTEKRTVGIHADLFDEKLAEKLSPGMYVEADIFTTSASKMSLPLDALVDIEGRYYVLMLESKTANEYTFIKKEVKAGLSYNNRIEILNFSDFDDTAEFLLKGAFNLITE
ncbi:MAG: efflux RND transporter periplasmic adaptor subunit [Chitinophagales bacterium]